MVNKTKFTMVVKRGRTIVNNPHPRGGSHPVTSARSLRVRPDGSTAILERRAKRLFAPRLRITVHA